MVVPELKISVSDEWQKASCVLCVRLDAMGDVLMTSPAIRAIKCGRAKPSVTLLTSRSGAVAAGLLPDVDDIIEYEAPWMKASSTCEDAARDFEAIEKLRERRFDAAVIFTVYSQNPLPAAMLCYLAQIPLRAAHCRENPYRLLTDWVHETEPGNNLRHEVQRQLDLAARIGFASRDKRMSVCVSHAAKERVREILRGKGIDVDSRRWLLMHPGARAASRRYPPESFGAAAAELVDRHGFQIVLTGGEDERDLVEEIRSHAGRPGTQSLCGSINFEEFAALVSLAPVLISNNSSPVHLASALGTPVVDLYALTNPQHTPWLVPHRVLFADVPCRFCYKSVCPEGHHACLRNVPPHAVVRAALELFGELEESEESYESNGSIESIESAGSVESDIVKNTRPLYPIDSRSERLDRLDGLDGLDRLTRLDRPDSLDRLDRLLC